MIDKLRQFLGEPHSYRASDEIRFCCPYCAKNGRGTDVNFHLYLNKSSGLFFCQRCEARGHTSFFLKQNDEEEDFGRDEEGQRKCRVSTLHDYFKPKAPSKSERPSTASLPDDYIPVMDWPSSSAARYLEDRGIPFELAVQRGIGFGAQRNRGRIIFPVFDPGNRTKCVFWVARSYTNLDHDDSCECFLCKYKYTNAPGVQRRHFIYGLEFCDGNGECCITEGAISALNSGENAIATFGKHVTDEQLDLMSERFDRVQVALDPDAYRKSADLMRRLLGMGIRTEWIPLPHEKDPADLGVEKMTFLRRNKGILITRSMLSRVLLSGVSEIE